MGNILSSGENGGINIALITLQGLLSTSVLTIEIYKSVT